MKRTTEQDELDDRLAEAQAQIDSLQAAAADAEARAATAQSELAEAKGARSSAEQQLAEASAARTAAEEELAHVRNAVEDMRSRLSEAVMKYREAKLASAPEVPQDLVPPSESTADIDDHFEKARRLVGQLRERMEEERQSARVPLGSPARRAPDVSSLPPLEKIRLGLQQLAEREGR